MYNGHEQVSGLGSLLLISQPWPVTVVVTVIVDVPFDELLQPSFQIRDWLVVKLRLRGGDICMREGDVTISGHFYDVSLGLYPKMLLEDVNQGRHGYWGGVSKVEDA